MPAVGELSEAGFVRTCFVVEVADLAASRGLDMVACLLWVMMGGIEEEPAPGVEGGDRRVLSGGEGRWVQR